MLVSVVMPTYNCARYIAQSIDSVLAQTVTDWELLIVDDCSTDNTAKIVGEYMEKYPNIHYVCLEENSGSAAARTEAIRRAKGKYIAFLDSDDIWATEKLARQIDFMQQNEAAFSCTAYRWMDADGNALDTVCYPHKRTSYAKCVCLSNPIGNLTVMYDQEALGKFEVPPIRRRSDFALWLQILKKTKCCYGIQENLATYRLGRKESVSQNKLGLARYHWQLYHEIEGHRLLRSAFEMGCWAFVKGTGIGLIRRREKC